MDATLTDTASIRTFSRLVICLSKLGHHLQFSPHPTAPPTISVRTINAAQSAYANFILHPTFFSSLHLPPDAVPVKISSRALQPILKSPQFVRVLRLRSTPNRLIIALHTRSALVKTFRLPLIDGRIGRTLFDRSACTSLLHASPRFLTDLLQNFHAKLDELTITPGPSSLTLSSFVDDPSNPANIMLRTEVLVNIHEFEQYTHSKPGNVPLTIFCRYFRAVLEFCESLDKPLHMWYDIPGAPVLFEASVAAPGAAPSIEAQFVFASRHVPDESETISQMRAARLQTPFEASSPRASNPLRHTESHGSHHLHPTEQPVAAQLPVAMRTPNPVPQTGSQNSQHLHPPMPHASASSPPGLTQQRDSPMRISPQPRVGSTVVPATSPRQQSEEHYESGIVDATAQDEEDNDEDDEYVEATPPP